MRREVFQLLGKGSQPAGKFFRRRRKVPAPREPFPGSGEGFRAAGKVCRATGKVFQKPEKVFTAREEVSRISGKLSQRRGKFSAPPEKLLGDPERGAADPGAAGGRPASSEAGPSRPEGPAACSLGRQPQEQSQNSSQALKGRQPAVTTSDGELANRYGEKTLALCREVLPGPPARPKPPKTDWCDRLQSLTGIDPCGVRSVGRRPCVWSVRLHRLELPGLRRDDPAAYSSMPIFICSVVEAGSCVSHPSGRVPGEESRAARSY